MARSVEGRHAAYTLVELLVLSAIAIVLGGLLFVGTKAAGISLTMSNHPRRQAL